MEHVLSSVRRKRVHVAIALHHELLKRKPSAVYCVNEEEKTLVFSNFHPIESGLQSSNVHAPNWLSYSELGELIEEASHFRGAPTRAKLLPLLLGGVRPEIRHKCGWDDKTSGVTSPSDLSCVLQTEKTKSRMTKMARPLLKSFQRLPSTQGACHLAWGSSFDVRRHAPVSPTEEFTITRSKELTTTRGSSRRPNYDKHHGPQSHHGFGE